MGWDKLELGLLKNERIYYFLDVDDEWYPEKTETQVEIMINDSSVLSYSNVKEIYDNNKFFVTKTKWKTGIFANQLRQFEISCNS